MTLNMVQEYQLPPPVSGQTFQLTTIQGSIVSQRIQGQSVFMSVLSQGAGITNQQTRTFKWLTMGSTWEDNPPGEADSLFAVLNFPNAPWLLLLVTAL